LGDAVLNELEDLALAWRELGHGISHRRLEANEDYIYIQFSPATQHEDPKTTGPTQAQPGTCLFDRSPFPMPSVPGRMPLVGAALDGVSPSLWCTAMQKPFTPLARTSRGFTLMEMMLVIAVAALILGFGVPNLRSFILNARMTASANDILMAVHTARSEAIKRQRRTVVC